MVAKTSTFLTTLLVASLQNASHAFAPPSGGASSNRAVGLAASADEAAAQAMSEYMVKSHESKLRAVKEVEEKKNAEIEALKAEIEQLKSAPVPVITSVTQVGGSLYDQRNARVIAAAQAGKSRWGNMEVERALEEMKSAPSSDPIVAELQEKVESYQRFIADYIVNAQNAKILAVKEAELKAEKKFQERLEQLFESSGMLLPASENKEASSETTDPAKDSTVFDKRNEKIIAAAAAGKSRWGDKEVERAGGGVTTEAPVASVESAEQSLFEKRNAKIVAAGQKSRWGDMEVKRAAEQAKNTPVAAAPASVESAEPNVFEQRNAKIVAAANAGKSRWGSMEVERAAEQTNNVAVAVKDSVSAEPSVFEQRNAKIVAAAGAGKSRWGSMEVERAARAEEPVAKVISLEDRVNLGARLLGV